jgi:recombination protein RecT
MSNAVTIQDKIYGIETKFNQVNSYKLNFIREAQFALQLLKGNDYLMKAAIANPEALEYAIINLAAIGISLNPALKEAYLVPRGGKICLDISYIGLCKLATDAGSIKWVQAQIVKEKDSFKFHAIGKAPSHEMNPFGERGKTVGVYCVAKTADGESLTTMMSYDEVMEIKNKSSQASKSGPWVTFEEEMIKKTVIKRASKLWPKSERVQKAVGILDEHEGIDFGDDNKAFANSPSPEIAANEATFNNIRANLAAKSFSEERLLSYLNKKFKKQEGNLLTSIEDLEPIHIEESYRIIGAQK